MRGVLRLRPLRSRRFSTAPIRSSSSSPSNISRLITTTDITAPHTGIIRILGLNRPAARNAISRALLAELHTAIGCVADQYDEHGEEISARILRDDQDVHDDQTHEPRESGGPHIAEDHRSPAVRALIVASDVDGVFCAGADLKERAGFTLDETTAFLHHLRRTLSTLSTLPIPTIATIAGPALGGGLELALCAHLRVLSGTSATQLGLPETRLGIIPGAGGTWRLPRVVGVARARDLILTGRRVGAEEALSIGLADRVVGEDEREEVEVEGHQQQQQHQHQHQKQHQHKQAEHATPRELALRAAVQLAREICTGGPLATRAALRAVSSSGQAEWGKDEDGIVEDRMYARVLRSVDRDEALRAFREKRRPVFVGR